MRRRNIDNTGQYYPPPASAGRFGVVLENDIDYVGGRERLVTCAKLKFVNKGSKDDPPCMQGVIIGKLIGVGFTPVG